MNQAFNSIIVAALVAAAVLGIAALAIASFADGESWDDDEGKGE